MVDEVIQPVGVQQVGAGAPGHRRLAAGVIAGEVVLGDPDVRSGGQVPYVLIPQGVPVILRVAHEEDLPALVGLDGVDPGREYTIKLEDYGAYSISYTASDTFNSRKNTRKLNYIINVVDDVAPEIKFEAKFAETVKVGDRMVIPKFTVTDNVSEEADITITKYVLTPSGVLVSIPENSNSVKAVQQGKYEFRVIAVDKAGNVAMERVTVTAVNE